MEEKSAKSLKPRRASIVMVLVLTLFVLAVSAKEKQHLPLSAQVLSAKTVYIDNSARVMRLRAHDLVRQLPGVVARDSVVKQQGLRQLHRRQSGPRVRSGHFSACWTKTFAVGTAML